MALFNKFIRREQASKGDTQLLDIIQNLNNILNTKKNYGSLLKNYGIRDLNEFNDRDGIIRTVTMEVIKCIELYEPRIKVVKVINEEEKNIFQLSFKIECIILETNQSLKMIFDTIFNTFLVEN